MVIPQRLLDFLYYSFVTCFYTTYFDQLSGAQLKRLGRDENISKNGRRRSTSEVNCWPLEKLSLVDVNHEKLSLVDIDNYSVVDVDNYIVVDVNQ